MRKPSLLNNKHNEKIHGSDKLVADFLSDEQKRNTTPQEEAQNSVRRVLQEIDKEDSRHF